MSRWHGGRGSIGLLSSIAGIFRCIRLRIAGRTLALLNAGTTTFCGWTKVQNGDLAEGISLLRTGLTAYRATGTEMFIPHLIALLATACEIAGQAEEAFPLLDDALQLVEKTGERWFAAELNRHKGQ